MKAIWDSLVEVESRVLAMGVGWPSERWKHDPVSFAREVLGVEPWSRQREVLEAVRDHRRVAVSSGHKIGKSNCAAILALWFFCSFRDARVVMTSTTARQVGQILWREMRKMWSRSKLPIGGDMHEMPSSGLKATDFREILGFTGKEAEAVAGISGEHLLYIVDEASGVPDEIFEAIEGNRAGGAWVVMFSNPTRAEGEFFEAFYSKAEFYYTIRISSEETPTARGEAKIPGLATREWIEEKRREWGVESALYKVRVLGQHVREEEGRIISIDLITAAEQRWAETEAVGRLCVGLDPSGPGNAGDETVFAIRRGKKLLALRAFRGITSDAIVANLVGILSEYRSEREPTPLVVVDREGPVGMDTWGALRMLVQSSPDVCDVLAVRASDRAEREALVYDRQRDCLWSHLARWIREGGAIPTDGKLERELNAPVWTGSLVGRVKATSKDDLRKILGRSPDRADALALSVWEPALRRAETHEEPPEPRGWMDPYARDGVQHPESWSSGQF